jgi:hypothetical protein
MIGGVVVLVLGSPRLRFLLGWLVAAYVLLVVLVCMWCAAWACCFVPRRIRYCFFMLFCIELFFTLSLTAYVLAEVNFAQRADAFSWI